MADRETSKNRIEQLLHRSGAFKGQVGEGEIDSLAESILAELERQLADARKALREQVERLSAPVSPKIPVGVVTVCIADYPDQSVTEYFRTRNGDWVVIVDSGESLRFDDEGYFPHGERGSEVKSVLIFRVSYTSGGVKSEEWRVRGQSYNTPKDALTASRKGD
jgi:hypothetical protein